MPRFYFHVYNDEVTFDEEGQEFGNLSEAREGAAVGLRSLAASQVEEGRLSLNDRIKITDESGSVLAVVSMRDAVRIKS